MIEYKYTKEFTAEQMEELFLPAGWYSGQFPGRLREVFLNSGRDGLIVNPFESVEGQTPMRMRGRAWQREG